MTASSGRECHGSFEDENKTVTSGEECVEHPRVGVDAMLNTMAGVTGDSLQALAMNVVGPLKLRTNL